MKDDKTITNYGSGIVIGNVENVYLTSVEMGVDVLQDLEATHYHIFVKDGDLTKGSCFTLPKDRCLLYMDEDLVEATWRLTRDIKDRILRYPALFMSVNSEDKAAGKRQLAVLGRLIGIEIERNDVLFSYVKCYRFRQNVLNENCRHFGLKEVPLINELDKEHWGIKALPLFDLLEEAGVCPFG